MENCKRLNMHNDCLVQQAVACSAFLRCRHFVLSCEIMNNAYHILHTYNIEMNVSTSEHHIYKGVEFALTKQSKHSL